jgi:hypothetical protein
VENYFALLFSSITEKRVYTTMMVFAVQRRVVSSGSYPMKDVNRCTVSSRCNQNRAHNVSAQLILKIVSVTMLSFVKVRQLKYTASPVSSKVVNFLLQYCYENTRYS